MKLPPSPRCAPSTSREITYNSNYPDGRLRATLAALGGTSCAAARSNQRLPHRHPARRRRQERIHLQLNRHRLQPRWRIPCHRASRLRRWQPQLLHHRRWRDPLRSDRRRYFRPRFLHRPDVAPVATRLPSSVGCGGKVPEFPSPPHPIPVNLLNAPEPPPVPPASRQSPPSAPPASLPKPGSTPGSA